MSDHNVVYLDVYLQHGPEDPQRAKAFSYGVSQWVSKFTASRVAFGSLTETCLTIQVGIWMNVLWRCEFTLPFISKSVK